MQPVGNDLDGGALARHGEVQVPFGLGDDLPQDMTERVQQLVGQRRYDARPITGLTSS